MMKKVIFIVFLFLNCGIYAQNVKQLKDKYFIPSLRDLADTLIVKELLNYDLFLKVKEAEDNRDEDFFRKNEEIIKESRKYRPLVLDKGKYFLKNVYQEFKFEIDENHQFTGTAYLEWRKGRKILNSVIHFVNGKKSLIETQDTDGVFKSVHRYKDSIVTAEKFNNDILESKSIIILTKEGKVNKEEIKYYTNGNIESKVDYVNKIYEYFYEDGTLERYDNKKIKEIIWYTPLGKKREHRFVSGEFECTSFFDKDGIIKTKECSNWNKGIEIQYYYKNGKLDFYEEEKQGVVKKYNKNGKLIETEKAGYPSIPSL